MSAGNGSPLIVRMDGGGPVRKLRRSHRALTGKVTLANGQMAGFESSLERDWLIALDFDWRIRRIQEQPYSLLHLVDGVERRYTPDVQADYDDGERCWTEVYEIKPHEELRANWSAYRARFKAAVRDCRARGWRFRIVTERDIRTPYVANAKFLRRYRDAPQQPAYGETLLNTLRAVGETTPQALLAASFWHDEHRMAALCELWRLVARREVGSCLVRPLTMSAPIWPAQTS